MLLNEAPAAVTFDQNGTLKIQQGSGGAGTVFEGLLKNLSSWNGDSPDRIQKVTWVGLSKLSESTTAEAKRNIDICRNLASRECHQKFRFNTEGNLVFLSENLQEKTYTQFDNTYLWFLYHNLMNDITRYDSKHWAENMRTLRPAYEKFSQKFLKNAEPTTIAPNDIIFVNDYQLTAAAKVARMQFESLKDNEFVYFHHIPFNLPDEFLEKGGGVVQTLLTDYLYYDRIGFQTKLDVKHFITTLKNHFEGTIVIHANEAKDTYKIQWEGRTIYVSSFPIARASDIITDQAKFSCIRQEALKIRKKLGDRKLLVSYQRGDPIKGIPQLLDGFKALLSTYSKDEQKPLLHLIATKGRQTVQAFKDHQELIEEKVREIEQTHPNCIIFSNKNNDNQTVILPLALAADVGIFGSIADGMCLALTEFPLMKYTEWTQHPNSPLASGTLVASDGVGAARVLIEQQLKEQFVLLEHEKIDDAKTVADALAKAITRAQNKLSSQLSMFLLGTELARRNGEEWISNLIVENWPNTICPVII